MHHLSSRIPFYRLPEVLRTTPPFADLIASISSKLGCPRLALGDEARQRLVSFKDVEAE